MANELQIMTNMKKLISYIIQITMKSPVKYRYSFVNKLHNLSFEIIELLYNANEIILGNELRLINQKNAKTKFKVLDYIASISYESECITFKQYSLISNQIYECRRLLDSWIASDAKRITT